MPFPFKRPVASLTVITERAERKVTNEPFKGESKKEAERVRRNTVGRKYLPLRRNRTPAYSHNIVRSRGRPRNVAADAPTIEVVTQT